METPFIFSSGKQKLASLCLRTVLAAGLLLAAGVIRAEAEGAPSGAAQIRQNNFFAQPLEWVGQQPPPETESSALLAALQVYPTNGVNATFDALENFLRIYPQSAWTPSVRVSLAEYYSSRGRYGEALAQWETAWGATKGSQDPTTRQLAVRALAGWTHLLASLGEKQKLTGLFAELDQLGLPLGRYGTAIEETREALVVMRARPGIAYRCGSYALGHLATALHLNQQTCRAIFTAQSPDGGFHMDELLALARTNGLAVEAVRRPAGAELVVPCVVHWKLNHYAAILQKKGDRYLVEDPTFESSLWMEAATIDAEASGEFILPKDKVPAGWQKLTAAECASIYGKGYADTMNDWDDDPPDCAGDDEDSDCDPPTPNDGDSGDGSPPPPPCPDCGMPEWSVSEPYTTVWLEDMPVTYRLSNGKWMRFKLTYKHRGMAQNPVMSGFGDQWACTWLGVLQDWGSSIITNCLAGGGLRPFNTDGTPDYKTGRNLTYGPSGICISMPSLAANTYLPLFGNSQFTSYLITNRLDRYGRFLERFNYVTVYGYVLLTNVVDMDGRTNTLYYGNSAYPNLITAVTDPYGQTAHFNYSGTPPMLTSIQDAQGMFTYFYYDSSERLTNMTTPYGATIFEYFDGNGTNDGGAWLMRSVRVTEADGSQQLYTFREPGANSSPFNSESVSYHWNRSQYQAISAAGKTDVLNMPDADYQLGSIKEWLYEGDGLVNNSNIVSDALQAVAGPYDPVLQNRPGIVKYDYMGQSGNYNNDGGSGALKQITAISLWSGRSYYPIAGITRNSLGRPTSTTYYNNGGGGPPMVYTNNLDASGQNLQNEQGPRGEPTRIYVYDPVRTNLIIAVTNAMGDCIRYTHDANTLKVTSTAFPGGLVRSNIYYASGPNQGFLLEQVDLGFHTNSFAYTDGNLAALTNDLGLVTTYLYDNLNRVVSTNFPDGTTFSNVYANLDLVATKDRLNQWTYYGYNAVRQLIAVTNADGQFTTYDYCGCGSPDQITRYNGSTPLTTQFFYDIGGRLTNTIYPDSYQLFYSYDANNNVQSVTDNGGHELDLALLQVGLLWKVQVATVNSPYGGVQLVNRMFDEYGRVTNSVDGDLVKTGFGYDSLDRLVWRQSFGSDGTQTGQESFGYSALGLTNYTDPLGHVTRFVRDAAGRVLYETNANNEVLQFTYNPADELLTLTDGKNQTTTWNYDAYGRVTNKVDAAGITNFIYQYDADDRLTNRWTPAKGTTVYRYDPVGNLTNVDYSGGTSYTSPIFFSYDGVNRLVSMMDGIGATTFAWTPGDQLAGETGPWPNDAVTYTYTNRQRSVMSVLAPNADAWQQGYSYDEFMRLTGVISPAGSFTYEYASDFGGGFDEVFYLWLGNNDLVENIHDGLARLTSTALGTVQWPLGSTPADAHQYSYDAGSEVTQQIFTANNYINYTYDNIGQLKTAQGYESDGTTPRLHEQFGYGYDKAWNLNYRTNNALIQTFAVNTVNELSSASRSGTLTVAGTATEVSSNYPGAGSYGVYSVKVNGQAASVYEDGTFAAVGFTPADGQNTYTAMAQDRYGRQDNSSITAYLPASPSYTNDANGDLLSDGTRNFGYDDENQLVSVWVANVWSNSFVYDGLLRKRIERDYSWNGSSWVKTNEVRFIYDGYLVVQERDANNLPQVTYTRGNDLSGDLQDAGGIGGLLARTDMGLWTVGSGQATAFYQADGNGNITCMVNSNGMIVAHYEYDPFGNMISMSGPLAAANRYRFSSKEWNESAGLYYYGRRFYDPNLQRWVNHDPLADIGGLATVSPSLEQAGGANSGGGMSRDEFLAALTQVNLNLFAALGNNPIGVVDLAGLFGDPYALPSQNGCQINGVPAIRINPSTGAVSNNDSPKELVIMMSSGGGLLVAGGVAVAPEAATAVGEYGAPILAGIGIGAVIYEALKPPEGYATHTPEYPEENPKPGPITPRPPVPAPGCD